MSFLKENGYTASIDRIDSSKGYIKGNIQIVHKTLNKMKLNMRDEEFIAICEEVYLNRVDDEDACHNSNG